MPCLLKPLNKLLKLKKYTKGQYIYSILDEAHCGFQIVSGRVEISNCSEEGEQLILSSLYPGDCFGDMGLIEKEPRTNNAIASEDTVLNVLSQENFNSICTRHPEIMVEISRMLCKRFRLASEMMEDAYLLPLYKRLAKVLIRLALSNSKQGPNDQLIITDVSQETLGLMVGATRQSVARELKKMESDNMIMLKYNKLTILDLTKMIEFFNFVLPQEFLVSSYPKPLNNEDD